MSIFDGTRIRYISHRGYQPLAPANSLPSFEYAGLLGQWATETDVRVTKDGVPVCCHDAIVDSCFDGSGAIAEMTWKELSKLRMNRGNRLECLSDEQKRMPLFSEYLHICRRYGSVPFVELKTDDAEIVIRAIREAGFSDDEAVMSSITLDGLINTRSCSEEMFVHWIFAREEELDRLCELGNAGLSWNIPDSFTCPREKITLAHERGLKVCLRAADNVKTVEHMIKLGLDYLPSNCMHASLHQINDRKRGMNE